MPDAIHFALCVRHQLVIVTLDKLLAEAARTLGIEVVWPGV
jgi:predicted nucleic acid-binding protein